MWMPYVKGCVSLSGEAGIGLFGALRSACSIVMDHSVLGRVGLGCMVSNEGEEEIIVPQDGLSMRVYHVPQHWKVEISAGEIQKIRVSDTTIEIQANVWGCEGAELSFLSIPKEGQKQQLLYQMSVDQGEQVSIKVKKDLLVVNSSES